MNKGTNNKILLSIIMPCYNCAEYLDKSVSSILNQKINTMDNKTINAKDCNFIEIILVDDASNDKNKTRSKIAELASNHSNIIQIFLNKNNGQAEARNAGINIARGEYINFVDADDELNDDLFITLQKSIKKHKKPDIICWGAYEKHYDKTNKLTKDICIVPNKGFYNNKNDIVKTAMDLEKQTLLGYLWNKIYKRSVIFDNNIKLPKERLIEDILFNLQCFKYAKSLLCINKAMYNYARRDSDKNTVTSEYLPNYFEQQYRRILEIKNWLIENDYYNEFSKKIIATEYIRFSLSAIWRNTTKAANMSKNEQKEWITKYFNLELSKELINYSEPEGFLARINTLLFKNKKKGLILAEARFIDYVSNNMGNLLIKARQSR